MPGTEEDSTASSQSNVDDTPSDNDSEPTAKEQSEAIPLVTNWLNDFHLGSDMAPASIANVPAGDSSGIKVNAPQEFSGAKGSLERFRMQCLLAIEMSGGKLPTERKKVLYIVSFLRGPAYEWVHPHFKDFLQHAEGEQKAFTRKMFKDYQSLFDEMEEVFDNGDEALEADRDIRALRQRTSAAQYRAEFQILAAKLDWNDDALASEFYRGLKDRVREEITLRNDRPSTFKDLSELAIKIDNRIFELQLEKRGSYAHNNGANRKAKRNVPEWNDNYYGLQKMQLDATKGKPGSNNKGPRKGPPRPQPNKGTNDKSNVECYGCGKKGHYKRDCTVRKQRHELQGFERGKTHERHAFRTTKGPEEKLAATLPVREGRGAYDTTGTGDATPTSDDHDMMSWTACYDDECYTHMGDKQGSGWFPTRKSRSVCFTRGGPTDELEGITYDDGQTDSSADESEDDTSDEDSSHDEQGDIHSNNQREDSDSENQESDALAATFPLGDITPAILRIIIRKRLEVFPYDGDLQHVHEDKFLNMIDEIRRAVGGVPIVQGSINYARIITERPPFGSHFTRRGGYTTPEGIVICRALRNKVHHLQEEFADEARTQRARPGVRFQESTVLTRGSTYQTDMVPHPLIERHYMVPQRLPTPNPSPQERFLGESDDECDSGN
jgi:hypothetical protein